MSVKLSDFDNYQASTAAVGYARDQPAGFTNRIERVAIVGVSSIPCPPVCTYPALNYPILKHLPQQAGGTVGKPITEALLKTGKHTVTALTRAGSTKPAPNGAIPVPVDYDDPSSLVAALEGQQFLIISIPAIGGPPDMHQKLVSAAAKAKVPYVMPNCYGLTRLDDEVLVKETLVGDGPLANIKQVVEAGVSSWITLNCGFWYEFSLAGTADRFGFDFAEKKVVLFDRGTQKIPTSTLPLCGEAVAALLSLKELPEDENDDKSPTVSSWRNKMLCVKSFVVSQRDMLDSANRVMGLKDEDWDVSYEETGARYQRSLEDMAKGDFLHGFARGMYTRVFFPPGVNGAGSLLEPPSPGWANEALGLRGEDLDEATRVAVEMALGDWTDGYVVKK